MKLLENINRRIKHSTRFVICVVTILLLVFVLIYYLCDGSGPPYIIKWENSNDTSCYNSNSGNVLLQVNKDFYVPERSIFFVETSCRGGLNSRQACGVESAARAHPFTQINVFFCSPITERALNQSCLGTLKQFRNIMFGRIHINEFVKGTPLATMVDHNSLKGSSFPIENFSNALRYLIMYKWGGIYLDTDIIVTKNLYALGSNWAGKEDIRRVNNAVLAVSKDKIGRKFAADLLKEFKRRYQPHRWGVNGPLLVTHILASKWCFPKKRERWSAVTCGGFQVYKPKFIYPIHYKWRLSLFRKVMPELFERYIVKSYTFHMWNRLNEQNVKIPKNSLYDKLAQRFCPTIYKLFGNKFGI